MASELHAALSGQQKVNFINNTLAPILNGELGVNWRSDLNKFGNFNFGAMVQDEFNTLVDTANEFLDNSDISDFIDLFQ